MRQVLVALALAMLAAPSAHAGEIVVTGEGTVSRAPDMATITLGVEREGTTAATAMAETSAAMAAVIEAVRAAGIAPADIQTGSVQVGPRWRPGANNGTAVIAGYTAGNSLRLRVRDLADLGPLLDSVLTEGANRLDGLSFGLSDLGAAQSEARAAAVRDARARAQEIADAAEVTLGPLLVIEESGGGIARPMGEVRMAMEAASAIPIEAGENEVRVTVRATYETLE